MSDSCRFYLTCTRGELSVRRVQVNDGVGAKLVRAFSGVEHMKRQKHVRGMIHHFLRISRLNLPFLIHILKYQLDNKHSSPKDRRTSNHFKDSDSISRQNCQPTFRVCSMSAKPKRYGNYTRSTGVQRESRIGPKVTASEDATKTLVEGNKTPTTKGASDITPTSSSIPTPAVNNANLKHVVSNLVNKATEDECEVGQS